MLKALLKKIQNSNMEKASKNGERQSGSRVETAENNSRLFLLRLAMVWDQFDFARDMIFPERGKQPKGNKISNGEETERHRDFNMEPNWTAEQQLTTKGREGLMRFAIENDRIDFIREFLQKKNLLKAWLTVSELIYLYGKLKNVVLICQIKLET